MFIQFFFPPFDKGQDEFCLKCVHVLKKAYTVCNYRHVAEIEQTARGAQEV